ncbi:hypothetical protein COLO4_03526 [Corchorus olitorius]|uniref:Uncharacterized protein n=1 Tax=Corchorus olitorius TaxID=93759 RepID=A0A1R3KY63_9ROSI|nr:hypothetical protein COLO4_03526 [Corchorus olitorius]
MRERRSSTGFVVNGRKRGDVMDLIRKTWKRERFGLGGGERSRERRFRVCKVEWKEKKRKRRWVFRVREVKRRKKKEERGDCSGMGSGRIRRRVVQVRVNREGEKMVVEDWIWFAGSGSGGG